MKKKFILAGGRESRVSNDDIYGLLAYNNLSVVNASLISHFVAEVCGENDEFHWFWILKLKDGRYLYIRAWCDYSGWDCQSGIEDEQVCPTLFMALQHAPEKDSYGRLIRANLSRQAHGRQAFGVYEEKNKPGRGDAI